MTAENIMPQPSRLTALVATGYRVTYAPDPAWRGCWYADLRDAKGRCIETGGGATQAEALASLRERAERSEPAALAVAAAAGTPAPDPAHEDRVDMVDVMTDTERAQLLAYIAGYAPGVFDAVVADRSEAFADELWDRIDARDAEEFANLPDAYCTACGGGVARFYGHEGPRHFRGDGTAGSPVELVDAGHEPVVAWRYPDPPQESPAAVAGAHRAQRVAEAEAADAARQGCR
jgi:hypothetical protein